MQPPVTSHEDINNPTEAMNATLILFAKAFQLTAPTNNNQRTSSNPRNRQIAQPNGGNQNGLIVVPGIANQSGTGNVVSARAEGTGNGNQARCYKCRGLGHIARNCTARPKRRDDAYLQTRLLIAQKEEHASAFGTQLNKAPVYDTDGSVENDNYVTSIALSTVQSGGTVETSFAPNEETCSHQETVYRNLVDQVARDRQIQNVGGNGRNQFGQYAGQVVQNQQGYNTWQNVRIQVAQNAVQNAGVQNGGNQNGLIVVPGIANQSETGNVVSARAEGTGNGNQARCYKCRGLGHIARNCTARPKRRDAAYLQTRLLIAQKEEAGIQIQAEEFDFMAAACDLDEIEEVNANCILMVNLQHASAFGTQLNKAPVYDTDGSVEVQLNDNCYDNEIFNMFTQEE
nr:hypothetical protein [Tanacetum cinerariifolium]